MSRVPLFAAVAALMTGGCGVKGPLYLPEKSGAVITAPAPADEPVAPEPSAPARAQPTPVPTPPSSQPPAAPGSAAPTDKDEDKLPH